MKKKVTGIFLAVMMLFSLVGCNNDTMQTKIDELEAKIEAQDEELSNLQEENAAQTEKIEQLEADKTALQDKLTEQEEKWNALEKDSIYSLEEAYEAGFINKGDLLQIAYYNNGGTTLNEELMDDSFFPFWKNELSEAISALICEALAENQRQFSIGTMLNITADDYTIVNYLGCYNGYYAFTYMSGDTPDVYIPPVEIEIDGVKIYEYHSESFVRLWKYKYN